MLIFLLSSPFVVVLDSVSCFSRICGNLQLPRNGFAPPLFVLLQSSKMVVNEGALPVPPSVAVGAACYIFKCYSFFGIYFHMKCYRLIANYFFFFLNSPGRKTTFEGTSLIHQKKKIALK